MKIGIITYHFAQNYGSVLQCYALQEYLKNIGYSVEIINFVSDKQEINNSLSNGLKGKIRSLLFFPINKKRKIKYNKFLSFRKEYLLETKKVSNLKDLKKLVDLKKYDYIISGSDQVFNPNINDFDLSFVFPFETSAKKIAYAASLGNAKEKELKILKKYLIDFNKISLRESGDKDVFEESTGLETDIVCDPVFLLSKNKWIEILNHIEDNYKINGRYLLCYFIHKDYMRKSIKVAKKIAKEKKLKIIFINAGYNFNSLKRDTIVDCGPCDFLKLFQNAEYICTDSFHGTSFSTILNKNFTCVDSKSNLTDKRRLSLLDKLALEHRYVYVENDNISLNDIDFTKTNSIIENYSNESKDFLSL